MKMKSITFGLAVALVAPAIASAAFVMPAMGGGQVGMMQGAAMVHTDVGFDGTNITLTPDTSHGVPVLRVLTAPDEFDPGQPWAVLQGKHYNFQHAWNPAGFITLPTGTGIWIERINHSPGLEVYQRPPASPSYAPILQSDGARWKWGGSMTHNAYAMLNPAVGGYTAEYKVYIGDANSGAPLSQYSSANVTWNFAVVPEPTMFALSGGAAAAILRRRR
jgi:hypothetical protein